MSYFTVVTEDAALRERLHAKMMSGELIQLEGVSFMPIEQNIENCKKLTMTAKSVEYVSVPAGTGRTSAVYRPQVGEVCEWRDDDSGSWKKVRVCYLSVHTALLAFMTSAGDFEGAYSPEDCQFRPIRTSEQIAAEEREETIREMNRVARLGREPYDAKTGLGGGCAALYDAGYRKFEIVDGEA